MRTREEFVRQLVAIAVCLAGASSAQARPEGPQLLCDEYAQSQTCAATPQCTYCHVVPPQLNDFGADIADALESIPGYDVNDYARHLPDALREVADLDSDGDGLSNEQEILDGTAPSVAQASMAVPDAQVQWEAETAFRRAGALFCGQTPDYAQQQAFRMAADKRQAVHALVSECLTSDYWRNEALHRMADPKIKPLQVVGLDGSIVLADYAWDYRLFSHVLTDDRDARDLLLADYHVDERGNVTTATIPRQKAFAFNADLISIGSGQPLRANRRAGMITTQWFLVMNTMFSRLPRTTAAQAYRAYLGLDIAASQGLSAIEGEPRDVDNKGVAAPVCAVCHSTLDPLAYAFSTYNGIKVSSNTISLDNLPLLFSNPLGAYDSRREDWESDGYFFGEPVVDLMQWAALAAETDAFKQNLALMFFEYALGRRPDASETDAFAALWASLPGDGYSANQLLHRLVDERAFGSY